MQRAGESAAVDGRHLHQIIHEIRRHTGNRVESRVLPAGVEEYDPVLRCLLKDALADVVGREICRIDEIDHVREAVRVPSRVQETLQAHRGESRQASD